MDSSNMFDHVLRAPQVKFDANLKVKFDKVNAP
jgi:hypothetical protein